MPPVVSFGMLQGAVLRLGANRLELIPRDDPGAEQSGARVRWRHVCRKRSWVYVSGLR